MIYTEMTKKALQISFRAHKDQVDKGGTPYVYHPFHLAEQMTDENAVCTALLHDVAEDSDVTLEDLKREGFPEEVIKAVDLLTFTGEIPYLEYIRRLKKNPLAAQVKMADLIHNSDETRLTALSDMPDEQRERYRKAIQILKEQD